MARAAAARTVAVEGVQLVPIRGRAGGSLPNWAGFENHPLNSRWRVVLMSEAFMCREYR